MSRRTPAHYYESIDYELPANAVETRRIRNQNARDNPNTGTQNQPPSRRARDNPYAHVVFSKYALTLVIGAAVGVTAWAIEGTTGEIISMQAALVSRYYGDAPRTTMSLFMITAAVLGTLGGWVATYYLSLIHI